MYIFAVQMNMDIHILAFYVRNIRIFQMFISTSSQFHQC